MGDTIKNENNQANIKENNENTSHSTESCDELKETSEHSPEGDNLFKNPVLHDYYKGNYSRYLPSIEKLQVPIIESFNIDLLSNFKDYTTRFYTDKYSVDFQNISEHNKGKYLDVLVRIHTNGLLLIALAPGNSIMQSSKEISEISFKINKTDRSDLAIRGKKKYGAKFMRKGTTICQVKLEGDPVYHCIKAGVCGNLIEYNELIKTKPNIMKTDPKGLGYICVLLNKSSKGKEAQTIDNMDLLTEEDYFDYLSNRGKYWKKET